MRYQPSQNIPLRLAVQAARCDDRIPSYLPVLCFDTAECFRLLLCFSCCQKPKQLLQKSMKTQKAELNTIPSSISMHYDISLAAIFQEKHISVSNNRIQGVTN
jgi:hypothetical protein